MNKNENKELKTLKGKVNHIFIDTETTGLGVFSGTTRKDQIIEIGACWREGENIRTVGARCNPGIEYLENAGEALKLQGRTKEEVLACQDITEVSSIIKEKLSAIPHAVFHAWNIPFDRYFVEQAPWHINLEWGEDPMIMASRDMGYSYDRIALWKAVNFYDIGMDETIKFHHALSDAYLAMRVWEEINKRNGVKL